MIVCTFKENGRKYFPDEKMQIVVLGALGVVKNVCKNFNISRPTYYRWKKKFSLVSQKLFGRKKKNTNIAKEESLSMELASKCNLLSLIPPDLEHKLKTSPQHKAFCIDTVKQSQHVSIQDACKSVGISSKTFYRDKDQALKDARTQFPALVTLDFLLEHKNLDKDSLALKMISAGIAVTRKEAGNLRWQAISHIKKHDLRKNPAVYQFLNCDDAWAMDIVYWYNDEGKTLYQFKAIDDRSRMDVGDILVDRATTKAALDLVEQAIKRTGRIPKAIKTDRGSQFRVAFGNALKERNITHLKSYPNFPEFNAKIERRFKDERLFHLSNSQLDLETLIVTESNLHNYVRPHESLSGLTPCEVYWKGNDPPFEKANATIESVMNWHPNIDTNLKIIISRNP